jgi:hypothetical protein
MKLITFAIKLIARMSLEFSNSLPLIANSLRGKLRNELEAQGIENIYSYKIYIYLLRNSPTPAHARVKRACTRAREGETSISSMVPSGAIKQEMSTGTVAVFRTVCFGGGKLETHTKSSFLSQ